MKTSYYPSVFLLCLLVILLSFCIASDARAGSYDHLVLVYIWPNAFCSNKRVHCKTPVPQNFTVHGLWPTDKTGKTLVYCNKSGSISSALSKYEKQLANAWPSLRRDLANRELWQYQWEKHGTCVLPKMTVLQYLQVIITQARRFDFVRALKKNGITTNGALSYSRKTVEASIREEIGGRHFYISCQKSRKGVLVIKEIYICLDGNTVISCPYIDNQRGCGGGGGGGGGGKNISLGFTAASSRIYA
ncbi:hypothetical protein ABFS82_08G021200 [Erythranthe guttata]